MCMARKPKQPNGENCSLAELETAVGCAPSRQSHIRLQALRSLLLGVTPVINRWPGFLFTGSAVAETSYATLLGERVWRFLPGFGRRERVMAKQIAVRRAPPLDTPATESVPAGYRMPTL